jgi:hypothetical protein
MTAILCLLVHGRIPVAVVEDHCVGTHQIHAKSTRTSGKDEEKDSWIRVEAFHEMLAFFHTRGAIQPKVGVPMNVEEGFKHVQHPIYRSTKARESDKK